MAIRSVLLLISILLSGIASIAQDTLPNFTVVAKANGRAIISWINTEPAIRQISIQRSTDSLKNFKSIMTVADPELPQNGFADTKAAGVVFYRLFIVKDSGAYLFSKSKRPGADVAVVAAVLPSQETSTVEPGTEPPTPSKEPVTVTNKPTAAPPVTPAPPPPPKPERFLAVIRNDSIILKVGEKSLKRFRDSVVTKTKDTLVFRSADTIQIKAFVAKQVYKPSKFVYTERDGNVAIALPEAGGKEYQVKFFEDNNDLLFEVKAKEKYLLLEKANFLHAGWFRFELFEDGKLKEKHKFFIPKDF